MAIIFATLVWVHFSFAETYLDLKKEEIRDISEVYCGYNFNYFEINLKGSDSISSQVYSTVQECRDKAKMFKSLSGQGRALRVTYGKDGTVVDIKAVTPEMEEEDRIAQIKRQEKKKAERKRLAAIEALKMPPVFCEKVKTKGPLSEVISLSSFGCKADMSLQVVNCLQGDLKFSSQVICRGKQTATECYSGTFAQQDGGGEYVTD